MFFFYLLFFTQDKNTVITAVNSKASSHSLGITLLLIILRESRYAPAHAKLE